MNKEKSEKDYMMLKSFSLFLNDNRKKRKDYESSFLFAISNSKFSSSKSPSIIDKETSIFLNIKTTIDILIDKFLSEYKKPYVYIRKNEVLELSELNESSDINWELTLEKWSKDVKTKDKIYVCSIREKSTDNPAINIIAQIISEIIIHAKILLEEFNKKLI